nr:MAG TPA: hypothetical protein [Caudoviricetes sp.]
MIWKRRDKHGRDYELCKTGIIGTGNRIVFCWYGT